MSGSFTSPKEENKVANLPVFASMPTLLFTPCSQVKFDGRQMMLYRLAGGLSVIRPMTESLYRPPQTNQTFTSNSQSNLRMLNASKPLPVSGAWKPGVSVESVECRSLASMSKPSIVSVTDLKNFHVRKPSNLAIEDPRKPLTPTLEGTKQTLNSTTNYKNPFNPASEDVRNPSNLTTDNTKMPLTVSSVWSLAGSAEHEQTGSPFITSKPSVVSVDDLKNCDAGCSGNGENPTPVLCVANANTVLKKQEEPTQSGAHNTLHSACTVSDILREQRRQNSDGNIQSPQSDSSIGRPWPRPRVITDSVDKTTRASHHIRILSRRHVKDDHCYAYKADKSNYTHISPEVRQAIINRKLKRTVSDEKDIRIQKESHPVVLEVTVNLEKQDERATSVNEMKSLEAPTLHLNDAGSFSKHTSDINSTNGVPLHGRQTVKSFSESLVTNSKSDTTFTKRPERVSVPSVPPITDSTISSIDQVQVTSGNPMDVTYLSTTRPKSPLNLPREKPHKVVSLMKINFPGVLLRNKQMFASMEVDRNPTILSDELDNDPLVSHSSFNQREKGLVNSEKRPPVRFESLLGHCRVVIKKLPFKRKYFRTKSWKKYLENELSKRQRRAFLKEVYDRPYAIRRNPTVRVL